MGAISQKERTRFHHVREEEIIDRSSQRSDYSIKMVNVMAVPECNWYKNGGRNFNEFIKTKHQQMECDYRYGTNSGIFLTLVKTLYADTFSGTQKLSEIGKYRFLDTKSHSMPVSGRTVVMP
jgi:hypothetical protein